jgi:hypothetical protein
MIGKDPRQVKRNSEEFANRLRFARIDASPRVGKGMLKRLGSILGHFRGYGFFTILEGRRLTLKTSALHLVMRNTHSVTIPDDHTLIISPTIRLKNLRVPGTDKVSEVSTILCGHGIGYTVKPCRRSPGMYVVNPSRAVTNRTASRILEILA